MSLICEPKEIINYEKDLIKIEQSEETPKKSKLRISTNESTFQLKRGSNIISSANVTHSNSRN